MAEARVIINEPSSGDWNMAVDHVLLDTANSSGRISVRFYAWSEPTLSLGYFQSHLSAQHHPSSLNCPRVRRSTGGGAILHDHEITYSLCVPSDHRWSIENEKLYTLMHEILSELLAEYKIDASLFEPSTQKPREDSEFLCFLRRTKGDLIVAGNKIGGSAQRRRKNALLQHGSVLLQQSAMAPELPGIQELTGVSIDSREFISRWIFRLEERLNLSLLQQSLDGKEILACREVQESTYASNRWTNRR